MLLVEKPAILGVIRAQLVLRVTFLVYSVDDILHEFDVNILTTEGLISFDAQYRYLTLKNIQDCYIVRTTAKIEDKALLFDVWILVIQAECKRSCHWLWHQQLTV